MRESQPLPRVPMLVIAFLQGIFLYLLYRAFDQDLWPSESPLWSYPLFTVVLAVPVLLLLSMDHPLWGDFSVQPSNFVELRDNLARLPAG